MNNQQCSDSLRPIIALFSISAGQLADYVAAILEACGWMEGLRFDRVCKDILREVGIQKPRPAEFIKKYRTLEERGVWPAVQPKQCSDCNDTGFRRVHVIPPHYIYAGEKVMDAMEPCHCNPIKIDTKPGQPGNPICAKIEAPPAHSDLERYVIAQAMNDPQYEAKVRLGWRKMGFDWTDDKPLIDGAPEMLKRGATDILSAFKLKNVAEKRETETEFAQRRDAEVRRLRATQPAIDHAKRAANDVD